MAMFIACLVGADGSKGLSSTSDSISSLSMRVLSLNCLMLLRFSAILWIWFSILFRATQLQSDVITSPMHVTIAVASPVSDTLPSGSYDSSSRNPVNSSLVMLIFFSYRLLFLNKGCLSNSVCVILLYSCRVLFNPSFAIWWNFYSRRLISFLIIVWTTAATAIIFPVPVSRCSAAASNNAGSIN